MLVKRQKETELFRRHVFEILWKLLAYPHTDSSTNTNIGQLIFKMILLSTVMGARRPNRKRTDSTNSSVAQKLLT